MKNLKIYTHKPIKKGKDYSNLITSVVITIGLLFAFIIGVWADATPAKTFDVKKTSRVIKPKKKKKAVTNVTKYEVQDRVTPQPQVPQIIKICIADYDKEHNNYNYSASCGNFMISNCRIGVCNSIRFPETNKYKENPEGFVYVIFQSFVTNTSNGSRKIKTPILIATRGDDELRFEPLERWVDVTSNKGTYLNPEITSKEFYLYQIPEKYVYSFGFMYYGELFETAKVLTFDKVGMYQKDVITVTGVK